MNISSCLSVKNLFVNLCFATSNDLANAKGVEKGFSLNSVSEQQLDNLLLGNCFGRALSNSFSCLEDSDQSLQQSIFRRLQAHTFLDALMQDNKDNNSGKLSLYV